MKCRFDKKSWNKCIWRGTKESGVLHARFSNEAARACVVCAVTKGYGVLAWRGAWNGQAVQGRVMIRLSMQGVLFAMQEEMM